MGQYLIGQSQNESLTFTDERFVAVAYWVEFFAIGPKSSYMGRVFSHWAKVIGHRPKYLID